MDQMFTVSLVGDQALILKMDALPAKLRAELVKTTLSLAARLEALVKNSYLSGPTGDHTLDVVSGNLRRSVHMLPITESDSKVEGGVGYGADVIYAAIHEFGGVIEIPEIVPVTALALHFVMNGVDVYAKSVKAHTVTMPERAPLRTAFKEMRQTIIDELKGAIQRAKEQ